MSTFLPSSFDSRNTVDTKTMPRYPFHCTCRQTPANVDLTDAYRIKYDDNMENPLRTAACREQLIKNLTTYGWSPVSFQLLKIPRTSPLRQGACHELWKQPKTTIANLFDDEFCSTNPFPNAIYRTSESGSAGATMAEPKKSWEVHRCTYYYYHEKDESSTDTEDRDKHHLLTMDDMTQALHSVITSLQSTLQLPPNHLVQENYEIKDHGCCDREGNNRGPCNVDLLRVFYYDKVPPPSENSQDEMLGSSPHTDWGTWTVVWQDHVGGLQTFCQACQVWSDVPAAAKNYNDNTDNNDTLQFIIHVGDATSIAMGYALQQVYNEKQQVSMDEKESISWPSPKHRVISPTNEPRTSLVYFLYPPPGQSLSSLSRGLIPWIRKQSKDLLVNNKPVIPCEEYYLLHDQSAGTSGEALAPRDVLDSIFEKPLQLVFAEKWNQVQR